MNDSDHLLAAMPVPRVFFKLAAPAAAAQLINILYNLVHRVHPGGRQTGAGGRRCTTPVILAISAFAALVSMGNAAIGAAANIVPDAALICGFHLGVQGAALAAVLSQGMSASFVIRYLCTDRSVLRLRLRNIRFSGKLLWPCILLGTSPALMQLTENLVVISFNTSLQAYGGDMAVASMSILSSVMQFVMLLLPGLVQGAQPLLSYNPGAENIPRVKRTFRLLLICCVSGSFLIWLLCMTAPMFYAYYRKLK